MILDELKLLLALNGNKRIPHIEKEIFANEILSDMYLRSLARENRWYSETDEIDDIVYQYSKYVIGSRWIEAEHILYQHGGGVWVYHYNKYLGCSI